MKEWLKGFGKFIIGFLLIVIVLVSGNKVCVLYKAWSSADAATAANVTMDNFLKIKFGDSYDSVCKFMGGEGKILNARVPLGSENCFVVSWSGGVKGLQPRYIFLTFNEDKRVDSKIQVGLEDTVKIAADAYKNINLGIGYATSCALAGGSGALNTAISNSYGSSNATEESYGTTFVSVYTWKNGWGNGFQLTFIDGRLTKKRKFYFGYLDEYKLIEVLGYVF